MPMIGFSFLTQDTLVVDWLQFPCVELEKRIWFAVGNMEHDAQVYLKNQWTDLDGPAQEALFQSSLFGSWLVLKDGPQVFVASDVESLF